MSCPQSIKGASKNNRLPSLRCWILLPDCGQSSRIPLSSLEDVSGIMDMEEELGLVTGFAEFNDFLVGIPTGETDVAFHLDPKGISKMVGELFELRKYCVCVVVFQLLVTSLAGGDQFLVSAHINAFESYYFKEPGDPCLLPVALRLGRADKHDNKADVSCKKENLPEFDRERGSTDQIEDQETKRSCTKGLRVGVAISDTTRYTTRNPHEKLAGSTRTIKKQVNFGSTRSDPFNKRVGFGSTR
ncbi:PREDICTED: PRUPE_5G157900 [Prunus dulcis]|uniref:PREDICTED: PRUPE_5G157900 n=1 Tax=Prunus dulcis TaxID=3755 RepID=A0A5E4ESD2_PRUDU|nr:hypothetical protein L3X38_016274 [Prunus dulcis]VVA18667.1 PREDICTED: PRUPE_5G157900 [Prunus dulcis]